MTKFSIELLSAIGEIFAFAIGTSILSTLGIHLEQLAFGALSAGQFALGLWLCLLGGVAFYFGIYAMGLTELFPRLRLLVTQLAE
jgi:hypothetical protein